MGSVQPLLASQNNPRGGQKHRGYRRYLCTHSGALTSSVEKQKQLFGEDLDIGVFAQGSHDDVLVRH